METVGIRSIRTQSALVAQNKRNLDDPGQAGSHQRVAKERMDHTADHQVLRMGGHGIPSQHDDDTRDQITLGPAVALAAQPHAQQAGAPPYNTHRGVLQVIVHPGPAPAVLGKRVDASPDGNNQRVKELLTAAGATQPELSHEQQDRHEDPVRDKRTSHDEMRQTLSHVVVATEPQRRNPAKQHLRPAHHRHGLTGHSMQDHNHPTDLPMDSIMQMKLQIYPKHDLRGQQQHQDRRERAVDILGELAALVRVSKEVRHNGDNGTDNLEGDMPS